MTENHQFESMKCNWDNLANADFYETLAAKLDFSRAVDLKYVKETVIEVVGKENGKKVTDYVLPAILVTAYYYKTGKETVILSKEATKDILSMTANYVNVKQLTFINRCIFLKIADGLLTVTDHSGNLLEVEGIYLLNSRAESQNALLVYTVFKDNGKYGFHYLSFPYGDEGNLFDYFKKFSEAIGLDENAHQSREILEFALNAIHYLDTKGMV